LESGTWALINITGEINIPQFLLRCDYDRPGGQCFNNLRRALIAAERE
jgi:hypothetical protein